ncbi:unnamed protein product [Oikopleura dioica]|uniref:J domain-containing protein n=1 Tax=Oikopleura dioica TaxID=34765 RepID=E4XM13_OIKDI|nr:unnamed protein product [Oikopleura dioica]
MSSTQQDDFYAMLGITESATKKEIKEAFAKVQNAYDTLFDGRKRKAYDRKRAKNGEDEKTQGKGGEGAKEQDFVEKEEKRGELEQMMSELSGISGVGHYYGNDAWSTQDRWMERHFEDVNEEKLGVRSVMREDRIRKLLKLLSLGQKKINLKLWWYRDFVFIQWRA